MRAEEKGTVIGFLAGVLFVGLMILVSLPGTKPPLESSYEKVEFPTARCFTGALRYLLPEKPGTLFVCKDKYARWEFTRQKSVHDAISVVKY